jgi:hypothetical protein
MSKVREGEQTVFDRTRKRWPIALLAILFALGAIAGSVGYALYPFEHTGPWTEELAFQRDMRSGVAMIGYVVCATSGVVLIACLLLRRRRP